jgi:hypothetical protein
MQYKELFTSVKEILPFDDEYNYNSVFGRNGYVQVDSYNIMNPIVNALYHSGNERVYTWFKICPMVNPGAQISFYADSEFDAHIKMNLLVETIMLCARSQTEYNSLHEFMERQWNAHLKLFGGDERYERQQAG